MLETNMAANQHGNKANMADISKLNKDRHQKHLTKVNQNGI